MIKVLNYRIMNDIVRETVMTELVLQENGLSIDELNAQLGVGSKSTAAIAKLKIVHNPLDESGNQLTLGAFYTTTDGEKVYATEGVRLRVLSSKIQYQHWGDDGLINKSILVDSQKEEARDQLGGYMCGMPTFEQSQAMTPDKRAEFVGRDRFRIIRGLVTYTGKTATGEEKTITNLPVLLSLKRKNYGPFFWDVIKKIPRNSATYDYDCVLSAERHTTPKGASYYVMRFAPDLSKKIPIDQLTYDSLQHVAGLIIEENAKIEKAFKYAHMQQDDEEEAARIMDAVDTLSGDY